MLPIYIFMFPKFNDNESQIHKLEAMNLSIAELSRLINETKSKNPTEIGGLKINFSKYGEEDMILIERGRKSAVVSLKTLENLYHAKIAMAESKKTLPSVMNVENDGVGKYNDNQKVNMTVLSNYMSSFIAETICNKDFYTRQRIEDEKLGEYSEFHKFFKNFKIPGAILNEMKDLVQMGAQLNGGQKRGFFFASPVGSLFEAGKCGIYTSYLSIHPEVEKMVKKGCKLGLVELEMPDNNTHACLVVTSQNNYKITKNSIVLDLWEENPTPRLAKDTDILNKDFELYKIDPEWIERLQKVNAAFLDFLENGTVNIEGKEVNIKSHLMSAIELPNKETIYKNFVPSYAVNTTLANPPKDNNVDRLKTIALRNLLSEAMHHR